MPLLGIKVAARAKLNLFLDVGERRSDGYHEIMSLMQSLELEDELYFRRMPGREGKINIRSSDSTVPCDETNLVCKAIRALAESTGGFWGDGIEVTLHKRIPVAAGLGGGSSDAAATLVALNLMWERQLAEEDLVEIGKGIGSDVPFCLKGGTAWVTGRGEGVESLKGLPSQYVVLASTGELITAGESYERFDRGGRSLTLSERESRVKSIRNAVSRGELEALLPHLHNSLESATISGESVEEYKSTALRAGASVALMTGSGPAVFALSPSMEIATAVARALDEIAPLTIITRFSEKGVYVPA